jgi:hypothetical protein
MIFVLQGVIGNSFKNNKHNNKRNPFVIKIYQQESRYKNSYAVDKVFKLKEQL